MYKKTKPRSVMELLNKNLSEREVAAILGCSRNTVSEIKELCRQQGMTWDDIQDMTDEILPKGIVNGIRTDESHLPFPLKKNKQAEDLIDAAREIGPNTFELIRRMYDEAKVKEQATQTVVAILAIADTFTPDILEAACKKSLRQYHMPFYKTVYKAAENLNNQKELEKFKETNKTTGIVRGADYYG